MSETTKTEGQEPQEEIGRQTSAWDSLVANPAGETSSDIATDSSENENANIDDSMRRWLYDKGLNPQDFEGENHASDSEWADILKQYQQETEALRDELKGIRDLPDYSPMAHIHNIEELLSYRQGTHLDRFSYGELQDIKMDYEIFKRGEVLDQIYANGEMLKWLEEKGIARYNLADDTESYPLERLKELQEEFLSEKK